MKNLMRFFVACMLLSATSYAGNYTWTGTTNSSWSTSTNWSPNGVPGTSDSITINTTTTSLVLTGKKTVKRLTMSNDTLNLGGDTLEITGTAGFNGGLITNGVCYPQATGLLSFAGTTFGAEVKAKGQIKLNGSTFNSTAYFEHTGSASGTGSGGNTFNGTTTLKNAGTSTFQLAGANNDTFNGDVFIINASPSGSAYMQLSHGATSYFNGNIEVSSSVSYGVSFSSAGNGASYLASGKTISIGSGGFTGTLLIRNFNQDGTTSQSLSLGGILNIKNSDFEGTLTATTGNLLLSDNLFHNSCTFTKTANSNDYSAGGNHFYGTLTLTNSVTNTATVRFASTTGDTYDGDITLITSTGNIQFAYSDTSNFKGDISINSSKITFNNSTGVVRFTGSYTQELSGSADFSIAKLVVNKPDAIVGVQRKIQIDSMLVLQNGVLDCDTGIVISFKAGSQTTGANDLSYIDGKVEKTGNSSFIFPVGSGNKYYGFSMSAPLSSTDKYSCLYYNVQQTLGDSLDTNLVYLSECRYWEFERLNGSSKVKVGYRWMNPSTSCEVIIPEYLRMARWSGSRWESQGNVLFEGDYQSGYVTTSDSLSSFGRFGIGAWNVPFLPTYCAVQSTSASTGICSTTSTLYTTKYGSLDYNVPTSNQAIKTYNINLHIFYDSNNPLENFDPLNNSDVSNLDFIKNWINTMYSTYGNFNQSPPNMPFTPPTRNDSRIRISINVEYHNDPALLLEDNPQTLMAYILNINPLWANQLNIFAPKGQGGYSYWGYTNMPVYNLSSPNFIISFDTYRHGLQTGYYNVAQHWAHEIGHTLGLAHTFVNTNSWETCTQSSPEYLWDIFGLSPGSLCLFPSTGVSNDILGSGAMQYISPRQLGRMHRALSYMNSRNYVEKSDPMDNSEIVVSSNETWDFDFKCYQNIRVQTGATLTITCNLMMKYDSKIIVEDGARLIIDGARVYTDYRMWHGIEVWGNRSQGQGVLASTTQGVVEFKNGAIIENAFDAVTTIKFDPNTNNWDWSKTGGIIIAENSTFKNNRRAFQFLSYSNFRIGFPTQLRNNLSSIKNCVFETTFNLYDPTVRPYAFISMYDVHGVTIKGNTFRNTSPNSMYSLRELGAGIISNDSRFALAPLGTDRNVFENLWYGVYCANSVSPNSLSINNTDFTDCITSVYANNINYLRIWGNNIHVPIRSPKSPDATVPSVGLFLDNSPSYLIENNSIVSSTTGDADYGMYVVNSGDQPNYIYNNTIDGFKTAGIVTFDVNEGPFMFDGLIINCNDFDHQVKDEIYVNKKFGSLAHGIGNYQGLCTNSSTTSRNRFFSGVCGGANMELKVNTASNPLSVIEYASSSLDPDAVLNCSTPTWVNNTSCTLDFDKGADCPPFIGNPLSQMRSTIAAYDNEINDYLQLLNEGLSSNLEYTIRTGGLDSAIVSNMIDASPYISQEYLIAIIDHLDEYNESGIFDEIKTLFVQNCGLTDGVLNYLRFKSESSDLAQILLDSSEFHAGDSNDALDLLIGLDNSINLRRLNVGAYLAECAISEDTLYQSNYTDSCISLINRYNNYLSKHDVYLLNGDYTTALTMLDSIDNVTFESGLHDFLYTLDTIKSRDVSQLYGANAIEDNLWSERDGVSKYSAIIRGVLTLLNDSLFEPSFSEEESGGRVAKSNEEISLSDYLVRIYPNPTNDLINYSIESESEVHLTLQVYDINGRFIMSNNLLNGNNVVNLNSMMPGLYIGQLTNENGEIKYSRFVKL